MTSFDGNSLLQTPWSVTSRTNLSLFDFPLHEFGNTSVVKRSFQRQWFYRWSWLHYEEDLDLAFCFTCVTAYQNDLMHSSHCLEPTFISTGFSNWKDATAKLSKHEGSLCHKDSVLKTTSFRATTSDVGEMLSSQLAKERLERRKCLLNLLSNARFLSRQGLAFRGALRSLIPLSCD